MIKLVQDTVVFNGKSIKCEIVIVNSIEKASNQVSNEEITLIDTFCPTCFDSLKEFRVFISYFRYHKSLFLNLMV